MCEGRCGRDCGSQSLAGALPKSGAGAGRVEVRVVWV